MAKQVQPRSWVEGRGVEGEVPDSQGEEGL